MKLNILNVHRRVNTFKYKSIAINHQVLKTITNLCFSFSCVIIRHRNLPKINISSSMCDLGMNSIKLGKNHAMASIFGQKNWLRFENQDSFDVVAWLKEIIMLKREGMRYQKR